MISDRNFMLRVSLLLFVTSSFKLPELSDPVIYPEASFQKLFFPEAWFIYFRHITNNNHL